MRVRSFAAPSGLMIRLNLLLHYKFINFGQNYTRLLTQLFLYLIIHSSGDVPELADGHDLGSCAERREGSSPSIPIISNTYTKKDCCFEN